METIKRISKPSFACCILFFLFSACNEDYYLKQNYDEKIKAAGVEFVEIYIYRNHYKTLEPIPESKTLYKRMQYNRDGYKLMEQIFKGWKPEDEYTLHYNYDAENNPIAATKYIGVDKQVRGQISYPDKWSEEEISEKNLIIREKDRKGNIAKTWTYDHNKILLKRTVAGYDSKHRLVDMKEYETGKPDVHIKRTRNEERTQVYTTYINEIPDHHEVFIYNEQGDEIRHYKQKDGRKFDRSTTLYNEDGLVDEVKRYHNTQNPDLPTRVYKYVYIKFKE